MKSKKLRGIEKAAIFLTNIGEDLAAEIIKHLDPAEIQLLGRKITAIEDAPPELFIEIADEFKAEVMLDSSPVDVDEYIKNIILKALGPEKASSIIKRISRRPEERGIDTLKWMDPKVVAGFIKNEHPQTIAVILSNLEPEQAALILTFMDSRAKADVITRVATMESLAPGALEELEEAISQNLSGTIAVQTRALGGIKTAAEILNQIDSATETDILSNIENKDADLAEEIQEQMFVFADIAKIDDRGIQRILKEVTNDQLILALKTADEELKNLFLSNMSERAREMLTDEMDLRGPAKLSEVEQSQLEVVRVVRKLSESGEVMIAGESEDTYV